MVFLLISTSTALRENDVAEGLCLDGHEDGDARLRSLGGIPSGLARSQQGRPAAQRGSDAHAETTHRHLKSSRQPIGVRVEGSWLPEASPPEQPRRRDG
jgi:hypothetical protein